MNLKDFLFYNKLSPEYLGESVGLSGTSIRAIEAGYEPSFRTAKILVKFTHGLIGYEDIIPGIYREIEKEVLKKLIN